MRAKRKAEREHHLRDVTHKVEAITESGAIPSSLMQGLKGIDEGNIPLLIPRLLEHFLTEQGIYRSSMTPLEAWLALKVYHDSKQKQGA
ncbi:hypothetical protein [Candidatus Chlorohelix sp.]|uniref:hypothetical protein n=1 Tax=Candidatus Chlorohelix sp. TaxID=3139201 RepID=UPI003048D863